MAPDALDLHAPNRPTPLAPLSWTLSRFDQQQLRLIVNRAWSARFQSRATALFGAPVQLMMTLTACHNHGCPLRLPELAASESADFFHDLVGIMTHCDPATGQLTGGFVPRFAARVPSEPVCVAIDPRPLRAALSAVDHAGAPTVADLLSLRRAVDQTLTLSTMIASDLDPPAEGVTYLVLPPTLQAGTVLALDAIARQRDTLSAPIDAYTDPSVNAAEAWIDDYFVDRGSDEDCLLADFYQADAYHATEILAVLLVGLEDKIRQNSAIPSAPAAAVAP